jgi:replicative DNA helicase Mcm
MLKMHLTEEELEEIKPAIETDLFRKYIAYSRRNIRPKLSDDTAEKLKEFYVALRAKSSAGSVTATPRQLEALVRLSEASAKTRLSDEVTVADVERAIRLTEFVLQEIAYDKDTGIFDIDRVVTEHPKSTRDRIHTIEEIIRELISKAEGGAADMEDILSKAAEKNVDRFTAEKLLDELKKKGEIYEPKHGKYMLTEE